MDNNRRIAIDENMAFIIKNPYLDIKVKLKDILSAVRLVKTKTRAKTIGAGIDRMHHVAMGKKEMEDFGWLIGFMRCVNDGSVRPPVDMDALYSNIDNLNFEGML